MPRNEQDPAASTQQFRVFASGGEATPRRSSTGLIIGLVAAAVVVVVIVAVLLIG